MQQRPVCLLLTDYLTCNFTKSRLNIPRRIMATATTYTPAVSADIANKAVLESTVGITEFVNASSSGFTGIIKQRYSDFIVREVGMSHDVAILKDHTSHGARRYEEKVFTAHHDDSADTKQGIDLYIAEMKAAGLVFEDEGKLRSFFEDAIDAKQSGREPQSHEYIDAAFEGLSKEARTVVHKGCKKYLPSTGETEGFQLDGSPSIKLLTKTKNSNRGFKDSRNNNDSDRNGKHGHRDNKRKRNEWPQGLHDYLKFVLIKENVDTMTAINAICKQLKINQRNISFSGTKDKRAVTLQWCTVFRRKPTDINRINSMKYPFVRVGDFEYCKEPMRLGQLRGNRFEIILRDISISTNEVASLCEKFGKSGFINYFGLQRFGRVESKSHLMGLHIIRGNWKGIIDMMFSPNNDNESSSSPLSPSDTWKIEYARGNYKKSAELIPKDYYIEKSVMEWLVDHPSDLLGAYNRSPKASRLICFHAYQSYIWNLAVSERISRYGFKCVAGDLVAEVEDLLDETDLPMDEGGSVLDMKDPSAQSSIRKSINDMVHIVKTEDVSKYDIFSVVLPLPGSKILLPDNTIKEYYEALLAKDGLTLASFANSVQHEYTSTGTYRRIVERPVDFEYKIIPYNDVNEELVETELIKIKKAQISSTTTKVSIDDSAATAAAAAATTTANRGYKHNALQLKFTLSPGTYATMLLRELTKGRTDSDFQSTLTETSRSTQASTTYNNNDNDNDDIDKFTISKKTKTEDAI